MRSHRISSRGKFAVCSASTCKKKGRNRRQRPRFQATITEIWRPHNKKAARLAIKGVEGSSIRVFEYFKVQNRSSSRSRSRSRNRSLQLLSRRRRRMEDDDGLSFSIKKERGRRLSKKSRRNTGIGTTTLILSELEISSSCIVR